MAGELGLLVPEANCQVGSEQRHQQRRQQQHVCNVETANDQVPREQATEDEE